MSTFFTFAFEFTFVFFAGFFTCAFVIGFMQYKQEHTVAAVPDVNIDIEEVLEGYETYHKPALKDVVVPFQRPVVKPVEVAIDWSKWSVADLRNAKQRAAFNIPLRVGGKVVSKKLLCDMYTVAMAVEADASFIWSEADAA